MTNTAPAPAPDLREKVRAALIEKCGIVFEPGAPLRATRISLGDAARMINKRGLSTATLSNIANGKWEQYPIAEESMVYLAQWLGISRWQTAETYNFKKVLGVCHAAQAESTSIGIAYEAGTGKTYALREYANTRQSAYYVECEEYFTKSVFLQKLRQALGLPATPATIADMVDEITLRLNELSLPLIIIDEADKLKDGVLNFFKTLYNKCPGCGFVLAGTPYFKKRVLNGARRDRQAYKEIYSRLGGEFVELKPISAKDVRAICAANGIADAATTNHIADACHGDLRVAERLIKKQLLVQQS